MKDLPVICHNNKLLYLLDPCDEGVALSVFGVGDLDSCLFTGSFSTSASDIPIFLSLSSPSSTSDLESPAESESVLEESSSVSEILCSPEIRRLLYIQ